MIASAVLCVGPEPQVFQAVVVVQGNNCGHIHSQPE